MATEADIGETIVLKEKCLTPGELYRAPQTVDYLVKSGNVNRSFEGNAGVTAGESFSELPLIAAKVPDQQTNTKQETCQAAIEISYQGENTMPEERQIKREGSFKETEVKETKDHEVVDEIGHQTSDNAGISSKMDKIEQPYLEVGEEEISKEEILVNQVESDKQASVEENQRKIEKETITQQKDQGREEDNDTELKASNGAATLEASKGLNEEPSVLTADLTDVETSTQVSPKYEHERNAGYAETTTFEEINTERNSEGVQGEENSPDVAKPIEKQKEEKDISHDSVEEASTIPVPVPSLEIQNNNKKKSAFVEVEDKLDSPSVTLVTDRSSMQEETSNVSSTEESQNATNLNATTNEIISSVDQSHVETSSDTQTKDLSFQEVDKTEISKMISETLREDYVKGGQQESMIEADSYEGEKVIYEATTEGKLDGFAKHGEKNLHEEMIILDASALEHRETDRDAAVVGEENISQAVMQNNQEESGNEKDLSSIELNQKTETTETEFHDKKSGETRLFEQETILVESKELGQDSNLEPQGHLHEASGDSHDEKKNENDSQACESTKNNASRVVTTEGNSDTSENEIEKLEKVHKLVSQYQPEIKDGEMSIEEDKHENKETCETEKHKSEITDDDSAKCHTEELGSEAISSTDVTHETMEQNFQAGSLHEAARKLKDDEEEDEKTSTTNDEITSIEKVTDEKIIQANATNLSSEVINEETVEGYLQIDKEIDVSKGEDIEEQIIEGTNTACIPLEDVEEAPVKNFENDENNIDNPGSREILLESEAVETVGSIGNEAKQSNDEIPGSTLQSSLVQEQEILHSENPISSERSSAEEISMTNDKENHTDQPQAKTEEHKDKGVEYLEQIKETEATLQESVNLPQADESAAETTKEENITNGRCIGSARQEVVDEDSVIFQKNESCIDKSNEEIAGESIAAETCENIASETTRNAECLIETIPTSLEDTNPSNEFFETCTYAKEDTIIENQEQSSDKKDSQEALADFDDIRNEIPKDQNLLSRELNENIEIAEGETPDMKIDELKVTHSLEKELGEITNFETLEQVHEDIGEGDEVKNDETESQTCKGTENTDSQHPSAKEAESTEKSEAEIEKLESVNASKSKEQVENKDVQNKEESCEEDIQKLETSDDTEKYHTEEVFNHEKIEQNFQAEETSTTSEGEENSRQTISVMDKEITGADEVTDDENIKENFIQISSEVTKEETDESSQQAEKEGDTTAGGNPEEKMILQKSIEEEQIENFQSYEKNSDKPSRKQNFEESETDETVASTADEAKQMETIPDSSPQSSLVTAHESSQSENQTTSDGSPAEEIVVNGSSTKGTEDKESNSELSEGGEHSKELLEEKEEVEQRSQKDNIEQALNVISLETKAETLSQIDNIMVKETAQSLQENEERDAGKEKDVILLEGEEHAEQILQNDNIELQTEAEASSQTDNSTVKEIAESPQENKERDAEKEDGVNESNNKCPQLESVSKNYAQDFENDDKRIKKSNTEILEVSEVAERGEDIIQEANQTDETPNATIPSSLVKEAESLVFEDKGIPEESSPEEKKEEGSSIILLEEDDKEIDKQTSEPVDFALEKNQNEESLNSSIQTSVGTETEQALQEEPREKMEHSLNNMEETVAGPQDDEGHAEKAKQDVVSESNDKRLPPEHVAQDSVKNFTEDHAAEKSNTEILEQPKAVESIENITLEIDQNDSQIIITPAALAEDIESLQCEDKDIAVEASAEEKKEEPSSIITGENNNGRITVIEENNKEGDGADKSNQEISEQPKAEESIENITDETNQNDSPNATNPAAPAEDVESLKCEDKDIAIEASAEEKKEEPYSVKTSEDSNDSIIMIEENNSKEGDQETCKADDYSTHEMTQSEESLSSSLQPSLVREEETLGSDGLTSGEASVKKDEHEDSYAGLMDAENREELQEKEEDAEQILQKDEPIENIEGPLNVKSTETEAETLSELKETVESPQDNGKRDAGRENDVIDENNIRSLPLESIAENPVKTFENDDPKEKIAQNFQDNTKNIEIPEEEEDNPKEHIIQECNIKSISEESVDQGTTNEIQNDENNDEISNKVVLEESSKGEIGESIALETNQNYEITNTTIPTAPVEEGERLQDESENVNLEEPSLEAEKEDDGSLAKANQVKGCNVELAEATEQSEAERSHGEENMEPKLQNERKEFLDASSDVISQVSDIEILDKKADEISIPEELPTVQSSEKTEEEETKGNEDSDGITLNDVSANEDTKLTAETYYANEVVEEKSVTSETDIGTTKAHVSDYSENLNGEHVSENNKKEMNEDNIIKFQGDTTACTNEDTEKHIIMEEHLSRDISPKPAGEETYLIKENKEEIAQIEMYKEFELPHIAEDNTQQVLDKFDIERDQCTEPAIVIADEVAVMVPKTEVHEIIEVAVENSDTGEQIMQEGRETEDILEVPEIDAEGLPGKDKDDENYTIESKQEIEDIKTELTEESAAVGYELAKVENLKDKQGSDTDLYPAKASEDGIMPKESTELDAICLGSGSKEETLGKVEPCISCSIKDKSIEEVEQENKKQLESSGPHTQEEGLVIVETTGTPLDCMSTNAALEEASNLVENKDHEIQTEAGRAEDLKFEIQDKALIEDSNNVDEKVTSATLSDKIPCDNLKESSLLPSNDSELMNSEESKPMDDNSEKDPTTHEKLQNEHISQVTELADNEDKITTAKEIPELVIEDIRKVRENEVAGSYNSQDLNQDIELHTEQYQVDQQQICTSETSKDEESLNVEDEASKCTESTNADKEEAILDKGRFSNKSEASLKEKDAAERATDAHVAGNINQVVVTTKTESSGVPAEENLESAEPSMKLDHISEMVPSNQSNETIPNSSLNKLEENQISEFVERRSQGSEGSCQEIEEKAGPDLVAKDQINETRDVEDIKVAIITEEVYTVENAEVDETVEHFNKDGDDIKELHNVPIEGEIIHEVKESGLVSSEYLKATDYKEQTETGSLEVREARDLEKESSEDEDYQRDIGLLNAAPSKETQEVIKEQIIDNTDSSSDIKDASTLEVKAEPRLEELQIEKKPFDIPSEGSSPHAAETDAGPQDSMLVGHLPSQLPTDDQENVMLENVALNNATVDENEERRETSDVHETKNHAVRELHTGEVREEIKEAVETIHMSQEKEIVTEAGDVIDHPPPKEITKEPEVPFLALPCKEEDCQTESTIENIEKHTEKGEMTKDKPPENSSVFKTVDDNSQLDIQVKKGSPDSPTEKHKEKGGTLCDAIEESEAASAVLQSKCHSPRATEVADDQTLHSEKSAEQYQTEPFVLLSKELELESSTEIKKLEDTVKEEELLEDEQRKSEEACLQREESSELQVSEPALEPKKDAEESSYEAQKEVNATSIEIESEKEASESNLDSNSKGNEAAKEEQEEITPIQTNCADKSQEENLMPSSPLLSEEQKGEASTISGSIEEKTKEIQLLEDEPNAIQDACLHKEEPRELTVPSHEFQPHLDEQESLEETHDKEDGATNAVKEEIEEISELELKSSSQGCTAVSVELSEFKPSESESQMGDDIQNKIHKEVHDGEDDTAEKSLELQSQHEAEKGNAEEWDLMALEHLGEKTTDAAEVVDTEATNEQIMEEKSYAKSSHAITPGEDEAKESHQEHHQIIEGTPGAQIFEKVKQNEVELSVETSHQREGVVAGLAEATEIIHNIHQQEKTSDSTLEEQISAKKELETMASSSKNEAVVEAQQQQEPNAETTKNNEFIDTETEGGEKAKSDENGKAIEKTVSKDSATNTISLQEMLQRSTKEKQAIQEGREKVKSDEEEAAEEEEEEEEEEQKKNESGSDGSSVMVESARDIIEVKIAQKKSHNILSGVGSKVKHSIIKVKKAITGGKSSSHTKQQQNHSTK